MAADRLTEAHRQGQIALRSEMMRSLQKLWPAMDWSDLDRTFPAWADANATLIRLNHSRSAALAASYLRAYRISQGVAGPLAVVTAKPLEPTLVRSVLEITARASAKAAAIRGVAAEQAMANAFVRSSGAATRLAMRGGRETITETIKADPRATGYERVVSAGACKFCQDIAGWAKGNDALNSDFEAHDHCGCTAQPTYR